MQKLSFLLLTALCLLTACNGSGSNSNSEGVDTIDLSTDTDLYQDTGINYTVIPDQEVGDITAATGPDDLRRIYGPENVIDTTIYIGEGIRRAGAVVFPNSVNRVEIVWTEEEPRRPEVVFLREAGSSWRTANAVAVGVPLDEVIEANQGDFTFYGFDWDYGGTVADWQGGALAGLGLRLDYNGEIPRELAGDQEISTTNPVVRDQEIFVGEMIVALNTPN